MFSPIHLTLPIVAYHAADQAGAFHLGTGSGKTMGTDGNLTVGKSKPTIWGNTHFVYHMLRRVRRSGEIGGIKSDYPGWRKAPPGLRQRPD